VSVVPYLVVALAGVVFLLLLLLLLSWVAAVVLLLSWVAAVYLYLCGSGLLFGKTFYWNFFLAFA
jgi:hypothetical protein